MSYYVGIDLHSNNSFLAMIDKNGAIKFKRRVNNDINTITQVLEVYKKDIAGIAIESTFNWYWLVDRLKDNDYPVHLANPCAMQKYKGLKHTDDQTDAEWLAQMLRLNILPTGYIYPKEQRPIRDLLRKRALLVQHRTGLLISLKGFVHNWTGERLSRNEIKHLDEEKILSLLDDDFNRQSAGYVNDIIVLLDKKIAEIENTVFSQVQLTASHQNLQSVWGIGKLLAMVILLETGDIRRFSCVGKYASYCRCVPSMELSNDKRKGAGNKRNGNKYLGWAYIEAAHFMRRFYPQAKAWFDKKVSRTSMIVASKALSNKIARACYFIMRDQTDFEPAKLFG